MNTNNEKNNRALVRKPSRTVEKAGPRAKRVLSGMVTDTVALVKKVQKLKPRFVLVDDAPEMLEMLKNLIHDWFNEATVLTFQKGDEAWQELQRKVPDILITDIERPNDSMDGWVMIPLLAEKKVKFPVVLLSAFTKGNELHQKTTSALNGNDNVLLGKILSGEFKDEDLQDQSPSEDVQNLLGRVSPPLNITFMPKLFDSEELRKLLEASLVK